MRKGWDLKMADPVDRRAVLHIIGNAFDDSAAFKSADVVWGYDR